VSLLASVHHEQSGGATVVRVVGEVDLSNAGTLLDSVVAGVPAESAVVVLDLSGTTYLDSSGIAMLFRLATRLRDTRRELRLVVPLDARIRPVLDITDVGRVIRLAATVRDALAPR
jgi:anti-anti-sigma factor